MSGVVFTRERADAEPGATLVEAMVVEVGELYGRGRIDVPGAPSATPEDFAPPGGSFLVGRLDGRPVACGGIKRLPDGACEIKRMYVVPEARGRGVATTLLAALEREARRLGYRVVRLDTGPKQEGARRMYEAAGYRPVADFNDNPFASFWGERRFDGPDAS